MRVLYIFPHPDDESFGPAPVIRQQIEKGHEVFLLTLRKGRATKVRHKLGLSVPGKHCAVKHSRYDWRQSLL